MSGDKWADNIEHELKHWDAALHARAMGPSEGHAPRVFDVTWLRSQVVPPSTPPELFRVLDVGSGPISVYGAPSPGSGVTLTCADALGDKYNDLLAKHNLNNFPPILSIKAEELTKTFPSDYFDWVFCSNALDHCEDPEIAFHEMVNVCRTGGVVTVIAIENEGEREQYTGLHQWNLQADSDGLWLWNKEKRINIVDSLDVYGDFSWKYVDHGQKGYNIISVDFRKSDMRKKK